jgi:GDP-L-fucose synthase
LLIADLSWFQGRIFWDTSKPNSQPRRKLDTTRTYVGFGFRAKTKFEDGLRETIKQYR